MNTELDAVETASKKAIHKAGEFLGNKMEDAETRSSNNKTMETDENPRNFEEIVLPLEKKVNY